MAITSCDLTSDKIGLVNTNNNSKRNSGNRVLKINFATDSSVSTSSRTEKSKSKKHESKSPYLTGDRVQLLSRVTEKRFVHKKTLDYVSSFPLAVNIYKANSDELKSLKRANKKTKKSVLTLPNEPTPALQICTASDMNDSEYYSQSNDNSKPRIKKRTAIKNVRKPVAKNKTFEFYDRDAQYCSQLNISLDSSSTDLIKNHKGDGKRISNYSKKKCFKSSCSPDMNDLNKDGGKPHDVWSMLRNMNRFQFNTSPPMSEESLIALKKNKGSKKRMSCKDTRVIETCRTEEYAYISSYKVDDSAHSLSPSSSFDRVTVINKQDEFSKICKQFEEGFLNTTTFKDNKNRIEGKTRQKRRAKKGNVNAIYNGLPKENDGAVIPLVHDDLKLKTQKGPTCYRNHNNSDNHVNFSFANLDDSHNLEHSEHTSICSNTNKNMMEYSSEPIKDFFMFSDNSKSSKAEIAINEPKLNEKKSRNASPNGRMSHLRGISGLIFGKENASVNSLATKRAEIQQRKPRLVTTMPSACMMPKLTQTEIKRRLATMRFPIVILGKDQVSSSVEVQNYEYPQFDGLDKQVWPFMVEWSENKQHKIRNVVSKRNIEGKKHDQLVKKFNNFSTDTVLTKLKKTNNEVTTNRQPNCKNKKYVNNDMDTYKNKMEPKRPPNLLETNNKLQPNKKQKSIINLKDKMLNLLYKKISDKNFNNDNYNNPQNEFAKNKIINATKKVDAFTETSNLIDKDTTKSVKGLRSPVRSPKKTNHGGTGYPWAKAKWASDFIENVIKKIKNGVYYSQDNKNTKRVMETSIQTEPIFDQEDIYDIFDFSPKVTITKKHHDISKTIPGFENSLPGLEIKTLNMNQIAVKHCVTNVMMQFDVSVPADSQMTMSPKTSSSLIPIEITESYTKIFKCKTTILNAMLPAELCSLVPKLMNLIVPEQKPILRPAICSGIIEKATPYLSTINEISRNEMSSTESLKLAPFMSSFDNYASPAIKKILRGTFSNAHTPKNPLRIKSTSITNTYDSELIVEMLPKVSLPYINIPFDIVESYLPLFIDGNKNKTVKNQTYNRLTEPLGNRPCPCTSIELYTNKNKRLTPLFQPYDFGAMLRYILNSQKCELNHNLLANTNILKIQYDGKTLDLHMNIPDKNGVEKNVSLSINNLKIDNLFSKNKSNKVFTFKNSHIASEYDGRYLNNPSSIKEQQSETAFKVINSKSKRKGPYRLYRKCKSTSTIPTTDKCINTPLNQIQNLDDFFQLLGSKKVLASVFDGYASKKILSSLVQIKTWITEISSTQALLILLLTNKKDTPNLVRFRPILLQGIAVNRITRATELDMEIEVIETEHFNKFSEYDGISYLPASIENQDQLLEELCWIAKTTASDYQRPFDESSEKLVKSLLEKRKKLNPSYLRVMARYVGLGLLKSPIKK